MTTRKYHLVEVVNYESHITCLQSSLTQFQLKTAKKTPRTFSYDILILTEFFKQNIRGDGPKITLRANIEERYECFVLFVIYKYHFEAFPTDK